MYLFAIHGKKVFWFAAALFAGLAFLALSTRAEASVGHYAHLTLQNDNDNNSIVNIGDTVHLEVYVFGDGGSCGTSVQADFLQYGGAANQNINGCVANGNSNSSEYNFDLVVQDAAENGIEVAGNDDASRVNVALTNLEESLISNAIGDGEIDTADGVDTIAPRVTILLPQDEGTTQHVHPLEVFTTQDATCTFQLDEEEGFSYLFNTGGIFHTDRFSDLANGSHTVDVRCQDDGGNFGTDTSTWTKLQAEELLYGADGAGGNPETNLYILDPETGDIVTTIGPINGPLPSNGNSNAGNSNGNGNTNSFVNYPVTGLAFDPTTGFLYGTTGGGGETKILAGSGSNRAQKLIRINPATAEATLIGTVQTTPDNGNTNSEEVVLPERHNMADIAFSSDGTLYGWSEPGEDDLYTIDLETAEATRLGESFLETFGSGLEFAPTHNLNANYEVFNANENLNGMIDRIGLVAQPSLYFTGEGDDGNLYVINSATGLPVEFIQLIRELQADLDEEDSYAIRALTADHNGTLVGSREETGISEEDLGDLVVIDKDTGVIISMGPNADMNDMDAIAFGPQFTATITFPTDNAVVNRSFVLQVTTNQDATCQASLDNNNSATMTTTGMTSHSQSYPNVSVGNHHIDVDCYNASEDLASDSVDFRVRSSGGGGGGGGGGGTIITNTNSNANGNTNSSGSSNTNTNGGSGSGNTNRNSSFTDTSGSPEEPFINELAEKCGAEGFKDEVNGLRLFMPNTPMKRGELIKLLMWCKFGELPKPTVKPFPDVEIDSPFAPYIAKAKELNFITGYEAGPDQGKFLELQNVSREEALVMILRVAISREDVRNFLNGDLKNIFSDTELQAWYYEDVYYSFLKKYTEGYRDAAGNLLHIFGVGDPVARGHAAKWIVLIVLGETFTP